MRITVGGLLLVLGVGAVGAVAFVPAGSMPAGLDKYLTSAREMANTTLGLFRSASSGNAAESTSLTSQDAAVVQSTVPVQEAAPPAPEPAIPVAAVPIAPVTPVVETPKPAVKKTRSRRRTARKKVAAKKIAAKPAAKKAAPAQAAAPAAKAGGSLIGSYVVLTLTTGREVKGILQEQDAIAYKVELPGLGAFSYPVQNVKSLRAAE